MTQHDEEAALETAFYSALTQNTYIEGNITTKDDLAFSGGIKGNIVSTKVVHLAGGIVEGAISVGEIDIENGKVKGNINSKTAVSMDSVSLVIGDVHAQSIECDGKIKGDLYIDGSATISANAVVFGNIKAAVINVDPGAMVKGTIEVVRQAMVASKLFAFEEEFMDLSDFAASVQ